jgi:hypothetical protein
MTSRNWRGVSARNPHVHLHLIVLHRIVDAVPGRAFGPLGDLAVAGSPLRRKFSLSRGLPPRFRGPAWPRTPGPSWPRFDSEDFLLPVRALSALFRAKFRDALQQTELFAEIHPQVWTQDWVVHC